MEFKKNGYLVAFVMLLFMSSCATNEDLNNKIKTLEEDLKSQNLVSNMNDKLYKDIISINTELMSVDGCIGKLENGEMNSTFSTDEIKNNINKLRDKLAQKEDELLQFAEMSNSKIKAQYTMFSAKIAEYKKQLNIKEQYIDSLETTIGSRDSLITSLSDELGSKTESLKEREERVRSLEKEIDVRQYNSYNELANNLNSIATSLPPVKGWFTGETKQAIESLRSDLYNKARYYRDRANNLIR